MTCEVPVLNKDGEEIGSRIKKRPEVDIRADARRRVMRGLIEFAEFPDQGAGGLPGGSRGCRRSRGARAARGKEAAEMTGSPSTRKRPPGRAGSRKPSLLHWQGEYAGKLFKLLPWQRAVVRQVFGWKRRTDGRGGTGA